MNPLTKLATGLGVGLLYLAALGCDKDEAYKTPEARRAELAKNVFLETQGDQRRVVVNAEVCLREGQLEQLLTRTKTKEHESILVADVDARDIHKALLATRAEAGSPVKYEPMYIPASGTRIKVTLRYEKGGKQVSLPAQQWVRNAKTGKDLDNDWVFAGSRFFQDPDDKNKPPYYLANDGDLICVSNFETALLDLPIKSPKDNADLVFEAHTNRIPEKGTKVMVVLEPILEKKP